MENVFGANLRALRAERSQREMAQTFKVSQATWANWETGEREPNFDTTMRLCRHFGVSIDWLLGAKSEESELVVQLRRRALEAESKLAAMSEMFARVNSGVTMKNVKASGNAKQSITIHNGAKSPKTKTTKPKGKIK